MVNSTSIPFSVIAKPVGSACNMDCKYCFYLEKEALYSSSKLRMNDEMLEKYIRMHIESTPQKTIAMFWQGGEPTVLGLDTFKKIIQWQKKHSKGKEITNSIQTNGILLNDEWAKFLADNNFLVGLSVDGNEKMHNEYRVLKGGQPTFSKVMDALNLLKKYKVEYNILSVLHNLNVKEPESMYEFLKHEIEAPWWQFIPLNETKPTEQDSNTGLTFASPSSNHGQELLFFTPATQDYADFMIHMFNKWYENDVGTIMIRFYEELMMSIVGYRNAGSCYFAENCGNNVVLEHNGDIFSCDHYVYDEYKLGNIANENLDVIVSQEQQKDFLFAKSKHLSSDCRSCEFKIHCNGGCPKHRINKSSDGEFNQNRLCSAYKQIFSVAVPKLRRLAIERGFIKL